jgi:hypothetical protein
VSWWGQRSWNAREAGEITGWWKTKNRWGEEITLSIGWTNSLLHLETAQL